VATQLIEIPDIGGSAVEVIEVCVSVGEVIEKDQSLVVLESDKASMEVPAPVAGKVIELKIKTGDKVSQGSPVLVLETAETVIAEKAQDTAAISGQQEDPPPAVTESVATKVDETATTQSSGQTSTEIIKAPDLGGSADVAVIEVTVNAGDEISEGQTLLVLESDKASMELPSPKAGKLIKMLVQEGSKVSAGTPVAEMEVAGANVSSTPASSVSSSPQQAAASENNASAPVKSAAFVASPAPGVSVASSDYSESAGDNVYAGPAVRRVAREFGVDLAKVKGTGPRGRVIKEDVQNYVKNLVQGRATAVGGGTGIPSIPEVDFSQFGEVDIQPLSKLSKVTVQNMQRSWLNVPHVTQFEEVSIDDLEDFRASLKKEAEQRGIKLSPLPFLVKACAQALKNHPKFNSSLHADGEHIVYKKYIHIGFAVDTPAGLVVPVIRNADQKSIFTIAAELAELAEKAKQRKLRPDDMQGGCFTVSSLGNIGGTGFTPIVNAPEVAILGVARMDVKPVWNGKEFIPRKMLPLSLSYDHRAINGADGGRFMAELVSYISDIRRLAL
jgi:pyruvate dehydrogenase E2 component (dihydrolipoamide acetyltransferase)